MKTAISTLLGEKLVALYLYGSRARGEATCESDWDLLVIVPDHIAKQVEPAILDALYQISLDYGMVLSCIVMGQSQWEFLNLAASPFARTVRSEGKRL